MTKQLDISVKGIVLIIVENNTKLKFFIRRKYLRVLRETLPGALGLHGIQILNH
jgi:hypothetical protein